MRDACRTLVVSGIVLLSLGALVALRIGGVPTLIAWLTAAALCLVLGTAAFAFVAKQIGNDPRQSTKYLLALPAVRIVAALALGWLLVGMLPMEAQASFWTSLVAAYLATLTIETGLLARLVRQAAALETHDVQGAV